MLSTIRRLISDRSPRPTDSKVLWPLVYLPENVLHSTGDLISSYGSNKQKHEGIAYWAGLACNEQWIVTTVIAPQATTTAGSFVTSTTANAAVIARVNDLRLHILAQVHGHPGEWVGHSESDNKGAFMPYEGFYSIVVPWYGRHGLIPLIQCGVHRYQSAQFVHLTGREIEYQFILVPTNIDMRKRE